MSNLDLFFRCFSRARWLALATSRGIYADGFDQAGNAISVVQPGFAVDELGFVVITPAVLDAQGNVVTPAVLDTWWSINLRVHGLKALLDDDVLFSGETEDGFRFTKSKLARFVREQSTTVTLRGMRAYQFGAGANRVQLIDSRDMVPTRAWLGGMSL